MRTPTDLEREQLLHILSTPAEQAYQRAYYLRNRKLKGRRKGSSDDGNRASLGSAPSAKGPRTGRSKVEISKGARANQRKQLADMIKSLEGKLRKLEAMIREKEAEERSSDRKSKAKSERAAKERDKPKTAAEKAEAARESKKYRDKNQQKLKSKANDSKSGGGSSSKSKSKSSGEGASLTDLKALRTKVKGQIAVAKQKLAAL